MPESIVVNILLDDYPEESLNLKTTRILLESNLNDVVSPETNSFRVDHTNTQFDGHDAVTFTIYSPHLNTPFHALYSSVLGFVEGFLRGQRLPFYTVETHL